MYSDSRKAQRNSFAHHRAELLFSIERAFAGDTTELSTQDGEARAPVRAEAGRSRVRAGLLGFVPRTAAAPAF